MSGRRYLTDEQVFRLNEEHGWFAYGDAQGDVSRAFANDAISMYERVREAAPDLLEALQALIDMDVAYQRGPKVEDAVERARAAIAKATGGAK